MARTVSCGKGRLRTVGSAINSTFRPLRCVGLYVLSALVKGKASYSAVPDTPITGTSGAIMGEVGAYLIFFPQNDVLFRRTM